jgi:hypothetical protein
MCFALSPRVEVVWVALARHDERGCQYDLTASARSKKKKKLELSPAICLA